MQIAGQPDTYSTQPNSTCFPWVGGCRGCRGCSGSQFHCCLGTGAVLRGSGLAGRLNMGQYVGLSDCNGVSLCARASPYTVLSLARASPLFTPT